VLAFLPLGTHLSSWNLFRILNGLESRELPLFLFIIYHVKIKETYSFYLSKHNLKK